MTVEELVSSVLSGKNVEVLDRQRIAMILKNVFRGYGNVEIKDNHIIVTYRSGRGNRQSVINYNINNSFITPEQLLKLKKKNVENS